MKVVLNTEQRCKLPLRWLGKKNFTKMYAKEPEGEKQQQKLVTVIIAIAQLQRRESHSADLLLPTA